MDAKFPRKQRDFLAKKDSRIARILNLGNQMCWIANDSTAQQFIDFRTF